MNQPSQPTPLPRRLSVTAAPEVEAGVYADFVSVWHQPHLFILDFSVHTNPPSVIDVDGQKMVNVPARMVSRVRIRPEQIWEIMKALEQQLSRWEKEQGRTTPRREEPPAE
jgi:Protein of unknown function (DUF3467)